MMKPMRRIRQKLSLEDSMKILEKGSFGVLGLVLEDQWPYTVPISYVNTDNAIYFHSAVAGQKIDAIGNGAKASFCVVGQDLIVKEEYTTYFRSVIVMGRIAPVEDEQEKRQAMELLCRKYYPEDTIEHRDAEINKSWRALKVLKLEIEQISGKEAIELVRQKQAL